MNKQRRRLLILLALPCALLLVIVLLLNTIGQSSLSSQTPQGTQSQHTNDKPIILPAHPTPRSTPTPKPTPTPTPIPVSNTPTNALDVSTATYLGSMGENRTTGVDVAVDGTILVSGMLAGDNPAGVTSTNLLNGGNGVIMRLERSGQRLLSLTRIGGIVSRVSINTGGQLVACGDFGVVLLDATASTVRWHMQPGFGARCSLGDDGTVAVLVGTPNDGGLVSGGLVYVYDSNGAEIAHWDIGGSSQTDITLDSTHRLIIATGFTQYNDPVQIAWLRAWSYSGQASWKTYDFSNDAARTQQLMADTRGYRVSIGRDGLLYFTGTSAGGNSIFGRDPLDIAAKIGEREVAYDMFNTPYNTSSNHITWYGRYDPTNGTLLQGQFVLTRIDTKGNKGNTINPKAIMADEHGRVYLTGVACYAIANRNAQSIGGVAVATYEGCEAFLYITTSDLRQRLIWTVFTASGSHSSEAQAVNVRNGTAVIGATLSKGGFITANALQSNPGNMYIAVWPQSAE